MSVTTPLVAFRRSSVNISNMPYKDCLEKLWADRQYELQVFSLIEKNGLSISLKEEVVRHKMRVDEYIVRHASLRNLFKVIRLRKKYNIHPKVIIRAIKGKMMRIIKNCNNY